MSPTTTFIRRTAASGSVTSRPRRRLAGLTAAAVLAAGIVGLAAPFSTTPAQAADPIANKGDVLVTAAGSALVTPGRVDKINPSTGAATVASSFSTGDFADLMAALPNGDFVVAMFDGRLVRVDHLTGAQRTIRFAIGTFAWADLAADASGNLFALLRENTGVELVSVDAQTGALTVVEMPRVSDAENLAVEWDGRVLITTENRLIRVTPATGQTSTVSSFATDRIRGLAVRKDSQIFVRTAASDDGTTPSQLIRVDPVSNAHTVVTSRGHLNKDFASNGMAFEDGTNLVSAEDTGSGDGDGVVRINTLSGQQRVLFATDPLESNDIAVAGVSQVPPAPQSPRKPTRSAPSRPPVRCRSARRASSAMTQTRCSRS